MTQYTNPTIQRNSKSQGKLSVQRTGNGRNPQTYHEPYWKDKECYNFHQKVHPYSHCPNNKNKKYYGDENFKYSKESKASNKNLSKNMKKDKNTFTKLQANIADLKEEESDLSD